MTASRDNQILFAIAKEAGGELVMTLLIPEFAYARMRSERTTSVVDLTKAGLPIKVIIGHCADNADGLRMLAPFFKQPDTKDLTHVDFSFDDPKKPHDA